MHLAVHAVANTYGAWLDLGFISDLAAVAFALDSHRVQLIGVGDVRFASSALFSAWRPKYKLRATRNAKEGLTLLLKATLSALVQGC